MKFWLWSIISWVVLLCFSWLGTNLWLRRALIRNHGRDLGIALWKQWRL